MSSEQDQTAHILKEARRICLEHNKDLIVSDLLELGDNYIVVLSNPASHGHEEIIPSDDMREVTPKLLAIKGVARVVVEIVRKS